jgi:ribosomal protein S4
LHGKIIPNQAAFFLVHVNLVPIIKQARKLCEDRRVVINGKAVNSEYIMKQYDLITFHIRKMLFWYKQKR